MGEIRPKTCEGVGITWLWLLTTRERIPKPSMETADWPKMVVMRAVLPSSASRRLVTPVKSIEAAALQPHGSAAQLTQPVRVLG